MFSILVMWMKCVAMLLLLVVNEEIVSESDVGTVVNCAACQHLDGPWNSWECRVQCNVAPQGVQIMGKYWMVPGTHGSVEYNVMWHHREFRLWVSTG